MIIRKFVLKRLINWLDKKVDSALTGEVKDSPEYLEYRTTMDDLKAAAGVRRRRK